MAKRIIAIVLTVALCFSAFPLVSFAESFSSGETTEQKELAIAKSLLFQTARILESKNNMIVVDEISEYDWHWNTNPELTTVYINQFNSAIKNNKSVSQKRERLEYLHNQKKASTVASLMPNALHFINVAASTGDPLKTVIALSGTALSAVASYTTEKQRQELELIQSQWELDDEQVNIFATLNEDLRTYLSQICKEYHFSDEELTSVQTLRKFIRQCNRYPDTDSKSAGNRLMLIQAEQFERELSNFPEYWAEMAIASFQIGDYSNALSYIEKYESHYVQVRYHDNSYAHVMEVKAYCINKTMTEAEKWPILYGIADTIGRVSTDATWEQKYFCVQLLREVAKNSPEYKVAANSRALRMMREVTNQVAEDYSDAVVTFLDGTSINIIKDGIQANIDAINKKISALETANKHVGKTQKDANKKKIKEYKAEIKVLEKNLKKVSSEDNQYLPPDPILLFTMMSEYMSLFTETGSTVTPAHNVLVSKVSILLSDDHSLKKLWKATVPARVASMSYDNNKLWFINQDDDMQIAVPARCFFFTKERLDPAEDKLVLWIGSFVYPIAEYSYVVRKGAGSSIRDVDIIFGIKVDDTVNTGIKLKRGTLPRVKLVVKSDTMQDLTPIVVNIEQPEEFLKNFQFEFID